MFESDQHEFDEEFAEVSHPAPPSPPPTPRAAPATMAAPTSTTAPASTFTTMAAVHPEVEAAATAASITTPELAASTVAPTTVPPPPATAEPAKIAEPAVATSAGAAIAEPIDEETPEEEATSEEQEQEEFVDPAEKPPQELPRKKPVNFILIGGFAALVLFAAFVALTMRPKSSAPPPGDMGPGIVAVSGLRGHLNARWDGDAKTGRLAYQLRIEPMEDRWEPGFSRVARSAPMPISVNIRLLDSTGFALCGKEIDFHFDPQNAALPVSVPQVGSNGKKLTLAERTTAIQAARQSAVAQLQIAESVREKGKDVFQNQTTDEGEVTAVNVQGSLPCAPDQFSRADYWDMNTNFPTLAEQAALVDPKGAQLAKEFEPPAHPSKRTLAKLQDGFVIQGDERVTGYDSAQGKLSADNKTFAIDKRVGQVTASEWASNYSLIHYRCDQHANCALTAAGQAAVLHARLNE